MWISFVRLRRRSGILSFSYFIYHASPISPLIWSALTTHMDPCASHRLVDPGDVHWRSFCTFLQRTQVSLHMCSVFAGVGSNQKFRYQDNNRFFSSLITCVRNNELRCEIDERKREVRSSWVLFIHVWIVIEGRPKKNPACLNFTGLLLWLCLNDLWSKPKGGCRELDIIQRNQNQPSSCMMPLVMLNGCGRWRPLQVAQQAESGSCTFSDASLNESSAPIWLACEKIIQNIELQKWRKIQHYDSKLGDHEPLSGRNYVIPVQHTFRGFSQYRQEFLISKTSTEYIRTPFRGVFECRFHDFSRYSSFLTQSIKIQSRDEPAQFECWDGIQCWKTDGWTFSERHTVSLPESKYHLSDSDFLLWKTAVLQLHWSSLFSFSAPFFGLMSLVAQTPSRISVDLIRFVCVCVLCKCVTLGNELTASGNESSIFFPFYSCSWVFFPVSRANQQLQSSA